MAIPLDDFDQPLTSNPNGVQRRTPGDFMRDGGDTPWVIDPTGATVKTGPRAGLPKLCKYGRPSSLGKDIENTYNLDRWNERQIVIGIGRLLNDKTEACDEQTVTALQAIANEDDERFRSECADGMIVEAKKAAKANLAAERGTHAHTLTELDDTDRDPIAAMENGEALGIPIEAQKAMLEAWRLLCLQHDIEVVAVEQQVVHDEWRQAGTGDRWVRFGSDLHFANGVTLRAGELVRYADLKTGELRLTPSGTVQYWHSYAVQCVTYVDAKPYHCGVADGDDRRGEWDFELDRDYAVIAHVPVKAALAGEATARLVLVDLNAARAVVNDVIMRAREWQARKDLFAFTMDPPVTVPVEQPKADRSVRHDFGAVVEAETVTLVRAVEIDEGGEMTDDQHALVRSKADALPPQAKAVLGALTKEAHAAGYPFSIGAGRTMRRWHIYRALLRLAAHFGDDLEADFIRATLAMVLPEAAQPAVELGPAIGSLTLDEAQRFVTAAIAVIRDNPTITFDDATGSPMWLGVDHQAA